MNIFGIKNYTEYMKKFKKYDYVIYLDQWKDVIC